MSFPDNTVEVFQRIDGRYDFRITAPENGNTLCSSNQGYEKAEEARRIAIRVVASPTYTVTFVNE